jgi:hypothetical protein
MHLEILNAAAEAKIQDFLINLSIEGLEISQI